MKNYVFYPQLLAFTTIVLAFAPACASAFTASDAAVSVSVSLDTPINITLGEPIILHCKIANITPNQKLGVLLGNYGNAWYSITLTDQAGKPVAGIPDLRPAEPRGLFVPGDVFLASEGSSQDQKESYDVVNQLFNLTHSGRYTLTAHVHLPYAVAPLSASGLSDKAVEDSGAMLTRDFVFPITVTSSNPTRLHQVSENLYQKINSPRSDAERKTLLAALFAMPEAQASTSWETLVNQADWTNREVLAEQLAKVHSVKTTDLLVKMLNSPALSSDEETFIRTKIDESYNAGASTVKDHIKSIAANRGMQMPDKVSIPQVGD